jgi:site-specific DNA-cytosine methylase
LSEKAIYGLKRQEEKDHQPTYLGTGSISPTINTMGGGQREPAILTPKRTEYGKEIRKDYESGNLQESRHNFTELEPRQDGISNALTTVQKDNLLAEPKGDVKNGIRTLLSVLRKTIDKTEIQKRTVDGQDGIFKAEILQSDLHEKSIFEESKHKSDFRRSPSIGAKHGETLYAKPRLRDLWEERKNGCSSQGQELSEQFNRQFGVFVSQLPHETTQQEKEVCDLWIACEGIGVLQQALYSFQKVWKPVNVLQQGLRIRKLCPIETWRLMGIDDSDFYKAKAVVSDSQLYKQAGNGIVVDVFMAVLRPLF